MVRHLGLSIEPRRTFEEPPAAMDRYGALFMANDALRKPVMTVQEFREIVGTDAEGQTDLEIHQFILRVQSFAEASFRECRQMGMYRSDNVIRLGETA